MVQPEESQDEKTRMLLNQTPSHHIEWINNELYSTESYIQYPAAAAKSLQSCPILWDPRDGSPPGSPIPGILQARTLEWVAISFSNAWKWKVKVKSLSHVRPFSTPWTAAYQAPPSMGFSRQEYWSGSPSPSLIQYPEINHNGKEYRKENICVYNWVTLLYSRN